MPAVYFNWRLIFYSPAACFRVNTEVPKFLESNFFSDENKLFCKICSWNNQALADQEISKVGDYLMIQVNHFLFLIKQWQRILVRSLAPPL